MKKYINRSLALFIAAAALSSCLKDDSMVLDPGKSAGNVVEFGNTGTPSSPSGAPVFVYTPLTLDPANATTTFKSLVRYSGAENKAPEDITVTLSLAPELITTWNAAYPTAGPAKSYNQVPTANVSFPATVVIKKGEDHADFDITVKSAGLDQTKSNVMGIKIASATKGIISGNFGGVIYNLPIKSLWDGKFLFTVTCAQDAALNKTNVDHELATVAPNRVRAARLASHYGGNVEYQFNGDNTAVTELKAYNGATIYATPLKSYTVDAAAKTFKVNYELLGRNVFETWVKK